MAVITPNTDIYLLKCPLEMDNMNQLSFTSVQAQQSYFMSLPKLLAEDNTYQRKDGFIRFPAQIDSILEYNYVMYKNENYSDKWIYGFITDMQYLNDKVTAISIKTDPYQTYMFDMEFKSSFVEREHVNDDSIGANTIDENLGTGDYMINGYQNILSEAPTSQGTNLLLAIQVTELPYLHEGTDRSTLQGNTATRVYNGLVQGCYTLLCRYNITAVTDLNALLWWYDASGKSDAVVSISVVPADMFKVSSSDDGVNWISTPQVEKTIKIGIGTENETDFPTGVTRQMLYLGVPKYSFSASNLGSYTITRNNTLNGYTPKNNKLFCSPYNFVLVTNNNGQSSEYMWENFSDKNSASFFARGTFSQGCSIKLVPENYKGSNNHSSDWNYGIEHQSYPTLSWQSDYYLNWIAQNSRKMLTDRVFEGVNQGMNIATSLTSGKDLAINTTEAGISMLENQANRLNSMYSADMVPNQFKGNSSGDVNFSYGKIGFTAYTMSVRAEVARCIDDYFSAFGYAINRNKVPNLTGRANWNYVKTNGANIEGHIPQIYIDELKQMFNNGVTIWHNASTFLDYSQNNSIVN